MDVLATLLYTGRAELFNNCSMRLVVDVLWNHTFSPIFLGSCITYILYVGMMAIFAAAIASPRDETLKVLGHHCGSVAFVLAIIQLVLDLLMAYSFRRHGCSWWNI